MAGKNGRTKKRQKKWLTSRLVLVHRYIIHIACCSEVLWGKKKRKKKAIHAIYIFTKHLTIGGSRFWAVF